MSDILSCTSRSDDSMNVVESASQLPQHTSQVSEQGGPSNSRSPSSSSPRAVSFSTYSQAILLPPPEDEDDMESRHYTQEDIRRFQQVLISDVERLRDELGSMSPEDINADQMYDCVGLEKFLSPELHRRTVAAMHAHVEAVLEEQGLQLEEQMMGGSIVVMDRGEVLAAKSRLSSAWSRGRAEELAAGYLHLQE